MKFLLSILMLTASSSLIACNNKPDVLDSTYSFEAITNSIGMSPKTSFFYLIYPKNGSAKREVEILLTPHFNSSYALAKYIANQTGRPLSELKLIVFDGRPDLLAGSVLSSTDKSTKSFYNTVITFSYGPINNAIDELLKQIDLEIEDIKKLLIKNNLDLIEKIKNLPLDEQMRVLLDIKTSLRKINDKN